MLIPLTLPWHESPSLAVRVGGSSGRADEPPLEVLPISVWSPASWGFAPPPTIQDEVTGNRDRFEATGDEDSLLSHAELPVVANSSILSDSDLRRVGALPVEEALCLLLQALAGNSVECLTEELGRLWMDLARKEALASRRGEVIAELKDEAYTQWASKWLAFQSRASQAFSDLEFNIQLSDEEVEGSASEAEVHAGLEVFSGALDHAPLNGDSRVPPGG